MIRKIMYWVLVSPFIVVGAFTSSIAWVDRKLFDSQSVERYFLWCEKVSKIKR